MANWTAANATIIPVLEPQPCLPSCKPPDDTDHYLKTSRRTISPIPHFQLHHISQTIIIIAEERLGTGRSEKNSGEDPIILEALLQNPITKGIRFVASPKTKRLSDDFWSLGSPKQESLELDEAEFRVSHWPTGPYEIPIILPDELKEDLEELGTKNPSAGTSRVMETEGENAQSRPTSIALDSPIMADFPTAGSASTIDTIGTRVFGTPLTNSPGQQPYVRDSSFSVASLTSDENGGFSRSSSTKTVSGQPTGIGLGVLNCDAYSGASRSIVHEDDFGRPTSSFSPRLGTNAEIKADGAANTSSDSTKIISHRAEWVPASHWSSVSSITSPVTPAPATPKLIESGRTTPRALASPRNTPTRWQSCSKLLKTDFACFPAARKVDREFHVHVSACASTR